MNVELVKKYLLDLEQQGIPNIFPRELQISPSNKITTVIGARRVGKTFILYQTIKQIIISGVSPYQILYMNFEAPMLGGLTGSDFLSVIELQMRLHPEIADKPLFLFFDEPQVVPEWEKGIRGLYDHFTISNQGSIFLSGSSSKLLSKEIATSLRGRTITYLVYPLKFAEYCNFKQIGVDLNKLSTKSMALLLNTFDEFIQYGGYPEVVLTPEEKLKIRILKDYLDLTIYQDIIERYKIKKVGLIKWLIKSAIHAVGQEYSLNKIYNILKSEKQHISKNTLYDYLSYLEDCNFVYLIRKYGVTPRSEFINRPKLYINDIGLLNLYGIERKGKRLENLVFIELAARGVENSLWRLSYWKDQDGSEVDFIIIIKDQPKYAIQVCYEIETSATENREIKGLIKGCHYFNFDEGWILTQTIDREDIVEGIKVHYTPFWRWALQIVNRWK